MNLITDNNPKKMLFRNGCLFSIVLSLLLLSCADSPSGDSKSNTDWPAYGGNLAGNRYSDLDQITVDNVSELQVVWAYDTSDSLDEDGRSRTIKCQPLMIAGVLYGIDPKSRLFALDASTGKELWKFEPLGTSINRGLNYWQNGNDKRIFYVSGTYLYGLDATTGELIKGFGDNGKVDFHTGLENDRFDVKEYSITATTPGVIYKNILVMGSTVSENGDALPGDIRGFDVRSGKLLWVFHTIPRPGEFGYDTWPKDAYKKIGGANNWAGMVLDEARATVYLGTGSPSVDFYGGDRAGENLFANCILALNAETGELKWHYQTISHDLWDLDISCPPNLLTVEHDGQMVDALVQTTKDGLVYVLDRETGKSLFSVEERPVPTTGLPGENPHPTQKFPIKPLPLVTRQVYTEADLPDSIYFPESHKKIKEQFLKTRQGSKYIPPSMEGFWYIGTGGGATWGGNAVDLDGILYQNVNEVPSDLKMVNMAEKLKESISYGNTLFINNCSVCHGTNGKGDSSEIPTLEGIGEKLSIVNIHNLLKEGRGRMPSFQHLSRKDRDAIIQYILDQDSKETSNGAVHRERNKATTKNQDFPYVPPYIHTGWNKVRDSDGYPGIKPPWGTLNAIDLNTGEYLWRVPLGEYDELTKKGIPVTGTHNQGGPIATAGGLVFIAATADNKIRAFDRKTGKIVWEYQLKGRGSATPITYEIEGRQFVVIAVSTSEVAVNEKNSNGSYVAFSLP